jgi:membrane protease YdiL (CAAX protease family)
MDANTHLDPLTPPASWPTPPPPPPQASIFIGRFGLRAGWSALIFIPLFLVFSVLFIVSALAVAGKLKAAVADYKTQSHAARSTEPHAIPDILPHDVAISEALQFSGLLLATFVLSRIERRRLFVYGIGRNRLFDVFPGAFWGLATLSLLVAILHRSHLLIFDAQVLHGTAIYLFGLKWLLAFLFVGFFEEYLSRGFFQFTLTRGVYGLAEKISPAHARGVAFSIAALVMSTLFGAGHLGNARENPMGIIMAGLAGVVFSYALWRTGSLWWAIGFHTSWDWAQSFLYGTPDSGQISAGRLFHTHPAGKLLLSGGIDGPEGSIYVIPIMLLAILVIRFTTRPGPQPPIEPQPHQPSTLAVPA